MCYINSSNGLSGNSHHNHNGNNNDDDHYQQQQVAVNLIEVLMEHGGGILPAGGLVEIFDLEVANENDQTDSEEEEEDDDNGNDFTAYEWMARTDLEQFDKETEQQYWHEVIAEAEASQRSWDQACASCPESDLAVLIPDYVEATAFNANLIRVAQEESSTALFSSSYSNPIVASGSYFVNEQPGARRRH